MKKLDNPVVQVALAAIFSRVIVITLGAWRTANVWAVAKAQRKLETSKVHLSLSTAVWAGPHSNTRYQQHVVCPTGIVSDAAIPDYDTSARYDLPGTSARCTMSDGDDPEPQARNPHRAGTSQPRSPAEEIALLSRLPAERARFRSVLPGPPGATPKPPATLRLSRQPATTLLSSTGRP